MNKIRSIVIARVRAEAREIKGSNERGPWAFKVVECLDADDNKIEMSLPKDCPPLAIGDEISAHCDLSVRSGYLQCSAVKVDVTELAG